MRHLRRIALLLGWLLAMAHPALAEERLALIIGNSSYQNVTPLENPANDARLMATVLEAQGFTVTTLIDTPRAQMMTGIRQFGRALRDAGKDATGLFYYAGHGVQSFGSNYLLPTDVMVNDPADLDLVAIEAQSVLRQMFSARNRTNIVILDACRNNPFSTIPDFNDNGLAEMQAPTGTFLSYATAPGGVALDGLGGNSPFTEAVAQHIATPGLPIEQLFKRVRVEVISQTAGAQTPWDASSLTSDFVFAKTTPLSPRELEAQQLWTSVEASRDPVQIMLFLRAYGDSSFEGQARSLLADVMAAELNGNAAPRPAAPAAPPEAERLAFEAAQAEHTAAAYQSFLDAFPGGTFAEFARGELAAFQKDESTDPIGGTVLPDPEQTAAATPQVIVPSGPLTFLTPLSSEEPLVNGRSIADLIGSTPLFPPVEGLPEEYWKGQTCSNCHQWTQARICEQAGTYTTAARERSMDKQHPFGGSFKRNLKAWAEAGCP